MEATLDKLLFNESFLALQKERVANMPRDLGEVDAGPRHGRVKLTYNRGARIVSVECLIAPKDDRNLVAAFETSSAALDRAQDAEEIASARPDRRGGCGGVRSE